MKESEKCEEKWAITDLNTSNQFDKTDGITWLDVFDERVEKT